jgi:hypothetical protein
VADDELAAVLAEIEGNTLQAEQAGMSRDLDRVIYTHGLVTGTAGRLLAGIEAALGFHERVNLYGNAATEDEPDACPHHPDSPLHFEDGDGSGEWLCEGKPEGAVCGTCAEDGLPVEWPCPEYSAILAALTGKAANDG